MPRCSALWTFTTAAFLLLFTGGCSQVDTLVSQLGLPFQQAASRPAADSSAQPDREAALVQENNQLKAQAGPLKQENETIPRSAPPEAVRPSSTQERRPVSVYEPPDPAPYVPSGGATGQPAAPVGKP